MRTRSPVIRPPSSVVGQPSSVARRRLGFAAWRRELLGRVRGRTLEIGCGMGRNFEHYGGGAVVTAFDVDADRLRNAARRRALVRLAAPVSLAMADAEHLAWPAQSFDAVVGTLVFCSIPQPARALAEARRVLAPGGRLYLVEHVRSHQRWLAQAQDLLAPAWLWATGGCNLNRNTLETVRGAGFDVEELRTGLGGLLQLIVARPA